MRQSQLQNRTVTDDDCETGNDSFAAQSTATKRFLIFANNVEMTPGEVIKLGISHEMGGWVSSDYKTEMYARHFRNRYVDFANRSCDLDATIINNVPEGSFIILEKTEYCKKGAYSIMLSGVGDNYISGLKDAGLLTIASCP